MTILHKLTPDFLEYCAEGMTIALSGITAWSGYPSYNLSVGLAPASSPSRGASGETVHFAGNANGSPFGGAGAKRLRGQARRERTAHAAISRLFVRAMLSLRPQIIVSILALSVTFGDTSPRGRGFVRTGKVCKKLQKPLANFPEMRYNTSRGKSAENRISASLAQSVRAPDC